MKVLKKIMKSLVYFVIGIVIVMIAFLFIDNIGKSGDSLNTTAFLNYLLFGGYTLFIALVVYFCTRYSIEHHLWKYHLPEKIRINLEERDRIEFEQKVKIEMLEKKTEDQENKIAHFRSLSNEGGKL